MKKILNTMNHELNEEQITELQNKYGLGVTIVELSELYSTLFNLISDLKVDSDVDGLASWLSDICKSFDVVILPIGIPYFMYKFSQVAPKECMKLFAHTDRIVENYFIQNGQYGKKTIFKHVKFLEV